MHAEKCPVCAGNGKLQTFSEQGSPSGNVLCHGCHGRGWIGVMDLADSLAIATPNELRKGAVPEQPQAERARPSSSASAAPSSPPGEGGPSPRPPEQFGEPAMVVEDKARPATRFVLTPGLVKRLDQDGHYRARVTKAADPVAGVKHIEEVEVYALSIGNLWLVDPLVQKEEPRDAG